MNKPPLLLWFLTGYALVLSLQQTDGEILAWERTIFLSLACCCILHLHASLLCCSNDSRHQRTEAKNEIARAERRHRNTLAGERRRRIYHLAQTVGLTVVPNLAELPVDILSQEL
jgi:hypothetical protein